MDHRKLNGFGGSARRSNGISRRQMLVGGAVVGAASVLSVPLISSRADASSRRDRRNDAQILNNALKYEHAAI